MTKYTYRFRGLPVVTLDAVRRLSEAEGSTWITLDLGVTRIPCSVIDGYVVINGERVLDLKSAREELREGFVYILRSPESFEPITAFSGGMFYKLRPLGECVEPTLEISGVHMHRIEGITPLRDAELKVRAARIRREHRVLDVCTGLGYTAIKALERGARVTSVEKEHAVLEIAELNPWSRRLEEAEIHLCDAMDYLVGVNDESYDRIIHDPPRFSLAGHLYSLEFYRLLYRALRRGGVLFHYTGEPGRARRVSFVKGVMERLRRAGFTAVRYDPRAQGVVAVKPA